jgi:large conductance mechanosensitive channel
MSFFNDFKKFAFKGNAMDLAVGVVIGSAFGKIISALVGDIVMPVVALFMPKGDWRENGMVLRTAADAKDNVVLRYGDFAGAVVDFFVISLILFLVVRKLMKAAEATLVGVEPEVVTTKPCPACIEVNDIKATRCRACTTTF